MQRRQGGFPAGNATSRVAFRPVIAYPCAVLKTAGRFMPSSSRPMRLLRHYHEVSAEVRGGVVALGNFDGVHRGHQAVIEETRRMAVSLSAPAGVMTFDPHPRRFFQPDLPPFTLTPFRAKARRIEALGVDFLHLQHFDALFAGLSAEDFISDVLVDGLAVRHVVVGHDYVFGRGRGGSVSLLKRAAGDHGFGVTSLPAVQDGSGRPFSSTRVRAALAAGNPREAADILGSAWEIEGRVEHGAEKGRTIGFPTANLTLGEHLLRPRYGVYAVEAGIDHGTATEWRPGVANLGIRPTVGGDLELLEVHLFDFDGDLYGQHLRVRMIDFLRGEQRFPTFQALKAQIAEDAQRARALFSI